MGLLVRLFRELTFANRAIRLSFGRLPQLCLDFRKLRR
jgi:hypothetical protein